MKRYLLFNFIRSAGGFMRTLFFLSVLCLSAAMLAAQDNPQDAQPDKADWEIQRDLYPARKTSQGRFGEVQFGTLTPKFDYGRQRLNGTGVFGSNNRILGLDTMSPSSRIHPQTVEEAAVPPRSAQDGTARYRVAPSANTVAPAAADLSQDLSQTVRTLPMTQRNPNFFEGITDRMSSEMPEDKQPIEHRWFRDIDRMNQSGINQGSVNRDSVNQSGIGGGLAAAVGSNTAGGNTGGTSSAANQSAANNQSAADNRQFVSRPQYVPPRNFERQLEEVLITSPAVQLLSPVQVSYLNGTATVRGVVANQQNKVDAGKVLLNVPGVSQVDNRLTVVPLDPVRMPAPIEPLSR
jgi:hypothetical protein